MGKMVYLVYSVYPGGDYSEFEHYDHIGDAKKALKERKAESLDQNACGDGSLKWQNTTPLRQITRKMLELGSIEYGSMIDPENIGTPCLTERENIMIAYESNYVESDE